MHIREMMLDGQADGVSGSSPSQAPAWNSFIRSAQAGNEIFGRLRGTTLTEQVVGFLERYRPAYGVR